MNARRLITLFVVFLLLTLLTIPACAAAPYTVNAIHVQGRIVGGRDTGLGQAHTFLWQNGKMTDLGTPGGLYSEATRITDDGQIGGQSADPSTKQYAVLWKDGKISDLLLVA